jgi:hypothetical protein
MDPLFQQIESWHGNKSWDDVLDAGTGKHSLHWILGQSTHSVTAITGAQQRKLELSSQFSHQLRESDNIIVGNWINPSLLVDQRFDIVIADYLLGAIEGFAPYFQSKLFARLKPHCKNMLYIIGQEPLPDAFSKGGELISDLYRLRDACILLAGHRCYREYPLRWIQENLAQSGYQVLQSQEFPMSLGASFVGSQILVCQSKLRFIQNRSLAKEMSFHIESLKNTLLNYIKIHGSIPFGEDYVIQAKPI